MKEQINTSFSFTPLPDGDQILNENIFQANKKEKKKKRKWQLLG